MTCALQRLADIGVNVGHLDGVVLKTQGELFGLDAACQCQAHDGHGHHAPRVLSGLFSLIGRLLLLQQVIERRA